MNISYASNNRKGAVDGANIFSSYVSYERKARIVYLLKSSPTPQPNGNNHTKLGGLIPRYTRYISHECLPQNAPLLVCTTHEK
jgi:hypothetical protein